MADKKEDTRRSRGPRASTIFPSNEVETRSSTRDLDVDRFVECVRRVAHSASVRVWMDSPTMPTR